MILSASVELDPFSQSRQNADGFCQNLFLSNAMHECIIKLEGLEKEYTQQLLRGDEELLAQKELELQAVRASLTFSAYILDCVGEG